MLGSIRHGDIIPHDDDIDVVLTTESLNKLIAVVNNSSMGREGGGGREIGVLKPFSKMYKFTIPCLSGFIDIFEVELQGEYYCLKDNELASVWPKEKHISENEDFSTLYRLGKYYDNDTNEFKSLQVYGPKKDHAIAYVHQYYGDSWKSPILTHVHDVCSFRNSYFYSLTIGIITLMVILLLVYSFKKKQ